MAYRRCKTNVILSKAHSARGQILLLYDKVES